jgi:protein-disulfide isomerase
MDNNNNQQEKESVKKDGNRLMVPSAIIVAGLIIGAAVMYSGSSGGVSPQPANLGAPPAVQGDLSFLSLRSDDHVLGDPSAKVTIIEYGDFECPFCGKMFNEVLGKLKDEYIKTGKAKLIYRHFPLNQIHPEAQKSAEASECAGEQDKFWEMHDILFANQSTLSVPNYKVWAGDLKLNQKQFNDCLDSGKFAAKVGSMYENGVNVGVSGTPATFINGTLVAGAQSYAAFKSVIDSEL